MSKPGELKGDCGYRVFTFRVTVVIGCDSCGSMTASASALADPDFFVGAAFLLVVCEEVVGLVEADCSRLVALATPLAFLESFKTMRCDRSLSM